MYREFFHGAVDLELGHRLFSVALVEMGKRRLPFYILFAPVLICVCFPIIDYSISSFLLCCK